MGKLPFALSRYPLSSRHLSLGMVYHLCVKRTTVDIAEAKRLAKEQRQRRAKVIPEPLSLLHDPEPVEGIDLNDTSLLWEIE